jgi:hypothetical protein
VTTARPYKPPIRSTPGRRSTLGPTTRRRGLWDSAEIQACVIAFACRDPRSGEQITVEQAVRVPNSAEWEPERGPAEMLCWGVLRSGLLRRAIWAGRRVPS